MCIVNTTKLFINVYYCESDTSRDLSHYYFSSTADQSLCNLIFWEDYSVRGKCSSTQNEVQAGHSLPLRKPRFYNGYAPIPAAKKTIFFIE